jgi:quercetin dioxygenase-like cupin family protein
MEYVRAVDFAAVTNSGVDERFTQRLFDQSSGSKTCAISHIKTPAGGGSPRGLHTHPVDQIFYVLSGTMSIEVDGQEHQCPPGSLIVFPAGMPHRNWNGGSEPTIHLAINTPLPEPGAPTSTSV